MEKANAILTILGLDKEVTTTTEAYEQFRVLKEVNDILDKRGKDLRNILFELAEKEVQPDEKGSYTVQFEDGTGYQKQARTSIKLKVEDTIQYLKDKGIEGVIETDMVIPKDEYKLHELMEFLENKYPEYLEEEEKVNEEYLEQAVLEGEIPMEDFENLVDKKTTFALVDLVKGKKGKK